MRKFNEKLNVRFDKKVYVIEEEIHITGGKYEGFLKHDNVDVKSVNVYSGTKLTGDKINSFALSTDDDLSWRTYISIQSNLNKVYVSYETIGDTVEAEDVNELQEAIVEIDEDLQSYKKDNTAKVKQLRIDVDSLENRKAEKTYVDRELNNRYLKSQTYNKEEIDTSLNLKADKVTMQNELNKRYTKSEVYTKSETQNKLDLKADKTTMQNELNNRYVKSEVYTKQETDTRIQNVIGSAPTALDTLQELANSLNNDANFASTMTKELAKKADKTSVNEEFAKRYTKSEVYTKQETQDKLDLKADKATMQNELNNRYVKSEVYTKQETQDKLNLKVDKISGKQLSTNDYTTVEKQKLAGIEQNANRYVHPATHTASMIVESSDKRFVSDLEKEKWNTVSNKLDSNNAEAGEVITTFTVASKRENIKSKEKLKLSFAKIAKYFNDLKQLAFTANWNDIVNKPSTFTPSSHSHVKADIADFPHTHTVNEITNFPNQDITDLKANKHNHSNKSVLDKITQTILEHITSAYNHISDNIRHISNEERIKWNKVDNKIDTNVANSKFATKEEIGNAGYGDMLKSIYDTNNDGKVDVAKLAESVSWSNISSKPNTFTPSSHTHTKAQITDFAHTHDDRYYTKQTTDNDFANKNKVNVFTKAQIIRLNDLKIGMSSTGGNAQGVSWHKDGVESIEIASMGALTSSGVIQKIYIGFGKNSWAENCVFEIFPNGVVNAKKNLRQGDKDVALKEDITNHKHTKAQIKDFAHRHTWSELDGKPSTFTPSSHTHTKAQISDFAHTHDDRYYTESEINNKLSAKSDTNHNHNTIYYTKSEIDNRIKKPLKWSDLKRGL